jgi:hypothetical protein
MVEWGSRNMSKFDKVKYELKLVGVCVRCILTPGSHCCDYCLQPTYEDYVLTQKQKGV